MVVTLVPAVTLQSKGTKMINSQEHGSQNNERRPVREGIQRWLKNTQIGKLSIMDPTRHKRKTSQFFVETPQSNITSKLNANTSKHRKALIEKILEPGDKVVQTVQLEGQWTRKLCIVSHCTEYCLIGVDFFNSEDEPPTIGLVLKLMWDTKVILDGDGGFSVIERQQHYIFKPVSVQALWTVIQTLSMISEKLNPKRNSLEANANDWVKKYCKKIKSNQSCINEWNYMADILVRRPVSPDRLSVNSQKSFEQLIGSKLREIMKAADLDALTSKVIRNQLEVELNKNLEAYKSFIDKEILIIFGQMDPASKIEEYLYLGSEWNASNLEELRHNGITHILNVTREIDNFFPGAFQYMNIRVYDEEITDLMKHFNSTYSFIKTAKSNSGKVLVHCKMGISRSASVVISFLMKEHRWALERTLARVKKQRSIVNPNKSFLRQLREYEGILKAAGNRQIYQGLFRSKSESCLMPSDDMDDCGKESGKFSSRPMNTQGSNDQHQIYTKTNPLKITPSKNRPSSEMWVSDTSWRPKSWSPNEKTARMMLDNEFYEDDCDNYQPSRCRCFDHFSQPIDNNPTSGNDDVPKENSPSDTNPNQPNILYSSYKNRPLVAPPVNSEACECDQMEYELCVPSEPVLVSHNKSDPVTDEIVQNLANFPLQLRTKFLSHYSSSSSTSSFSSSVPSTPIALPKRQTSVTETESSEYEKEEVLSVKTLANMFDFKSGTAHIPTSKLVVSRVEDNKLFQRAARLCENQEHVNDHQLCHLQDKEHQQ